MMRRIYWLAALSLLAFSTQSHAANIDANTEKFLTNICEQNMFAINAGKWTMDHTTNNDVRNFAQHEIDDHNAMNSDVTTLSTKVGFTRPADMGPMKQEKLDKLSKLSGRDADKFYLDASVAMHEHAVKHFDEQSTGGQNADVSAFAAKYITALREHLRSARDLDDKLSKTSAVFPAPVQQEQQPMSVSYTRQDEMYPRVERRSYGGEGEMFQRVEDHSYSRTALPESVSYVRSSDCCPSDNCEYGCAASNCNTCDRCESRVYSREYDTSTPVYSNDWRAGETEMIH